MHDSSRALPGSLTPKLFTGKTQHIPTAGEIPLVTGIGGRKPSVTFRMVNRRACELSTDSVCYPQFPHPLDRVDVNITQKDISKYIRILKATTEI